MQLRFAETMAGTFTDLEGNQSSIVFTVSATTMRARAFVTGAPFRLEGTITVGNICRDAPATGTLEVRLLSDRQLVYTLRFDVDGDTYQYIGKKEVSALNLLASMTTLRGELLRETNVIGTAELSFSLRDIPEFLRSFEAP